MQQQLPCFYFLFLFLPLDMVQRVVAWVQWSSDQKTGIHQVFAATTNGTFGSQTLGITFGTSNCGDHGLVKISKEREVFAQENYTSLVKEMAQGKGENLSTLASLYQCPAAKHQEFGAMVQEKFDSLVASDQTTSTELLSQLENQLTRHPTLASSCNIKQAALN